MSYVAYRQYKNALGALGTYVADHRLHGGPPSLSHQLAVVIGSRHRSLRLQDLRDTYRCHHRVGEDALAVADDEVQF